MVATVAVLTAGVVAALWWGVASGTSGAQLVTARLDALKIGLSIAVGGGGIFALYLNWRKQRATEADLDNRERALAHQLEVAADTKAHQEQVANDNREDALERRITEQYGKAVEQLGSDKAPVRLGDLYALERLAQANPTQRQTIVEVICAYLRMPYQLPGDPPGDDADDKLVERYEVRIQEQQVRLAAQSILHRHLQPGDSPDKPLDTYWPNIDLDLTGATLINFTLLKCRLKSARFDHAQFSGPTWFNKAQFSGDTSFGEAHFSHWASFKEATFASGFTADPYAKPCWVRLDVPAQVAEHRFWPKGWSVTPVDARPPGVEEGQWGHLVPAPDTEQPAPPQDDPDPADDTPRPDDD